MSQDELLEDLARLTDLVIQDSRWEAEHDDLGVSVLGMITYGYALMIGRAIFWLDVEDIDRAVVRTLCERVGAASMWTSGLVAEANRSSLDKSYHPGNYALIGIGHSYFRVDDQSAIADNVFENIRAHRRA